MWGQGSVRPFRDSRVLFKGEEGKNTFSYPIYPILEDPQEDTSIFSPQVLFHGESLAGLSHTGSGHSSMVPVPSQIYSLDASYFLMQGAYFLSFLS